MDRRDRGARLAWTRREFLVRAGGGTLAGVGIAGLPGCARRRPGQATFIARVARYDVELAAPILRGLRELGVTGSEIKGKRILLKPNLVEPHLGAGHINTHPSVVRGAAEAFRRLGAAEILVGDAPGHCRDSLLVLEESRLGEVLAADRLRYVDLNAAAVTTVPNLGGRTRLARLTLPAVARQVDFIVSLAKLKTHHWAGVTLALKNLFGLLPGAYYGYPKNLLHREGIPKSIVDVAATVRAHFAIVDGIVGMEGDGPIMGAARPVGVLVLGRNLPAVDATCARVMGIDPLKVTYLAAAAGWLGPVAAAEIGQRGEAIAAVRTEFALPEHIPALRGLRG
ncbi:MAG: DUF362 domain-containing protein [Deltaproteobacteria bacterium]|nr:DUF362 domain-containing protein [Deltaproteobacteria bacterium]